MIKNICKVSFWIFLVITLGGVLAYCIFFLSEPTLPTSDSSSPSESIKNPPPNLSSHKPEDENLQDLASQLSLGGEAFLKAAQKLIEIGTYEAIRTLITGISKLPPSRETMGIIYSLYDFPNREIAEWIAAVLSVFPDNPDQFDRIYLLCMVAGSQATPEGLERIAQMARSSAVPFTKSILLQIIKLGSASGTVPALMKLAQTQDMVEAQSDSVEYAAVKALSNQGGVEGVEFLFQQFAKTSDPVSQSLYASTIAEIDQVEAVPFLLVVAKGQDASLANPEMRAMAMAVLSNMDDENAWHTLRDLKDDTDPAISEIADNALDRVSARTGFEFE